MAAGAARVVCGTAGIGGDRVVGAGRGWGGGAFGPSAVSRLGGAERPSPLPGKLPPPPHGGEAPAARRCPAGFLQEMPRIERLCDQTAQRRGGAGRCEERGGRKA